MQVRGFAALAFPESAGISLARAVERAFCDPTIDFPEAWIVEERSIEFSLSAELDASALRGIKRLLVELVREGGDGEAHVDVDGERWDARLIASSPPRADSGPAGDFDERQTLRAKSG